MPQPARVLTLGDRSGTIAEWSVWTGIPIETIRTRIDVLGKSTAEALTKPVDRRFRRGGRPKAGVPRPCPEMKKHATGQAFARWKVAGQTFNRYFGPWGSEESRQAYKRFAVEWAEGLATVRAAGHGGATVAELCVAYLRYAEGYYRKDGRPTSEVAIIRAAIRELVDWVPDKLVTDMRADDLEGLQAALARRKLARETINKYIARIQRLFGWGAGKTAVSGRPLVPSDVLVSVQAVRGLRAGRSAAREPADKRAVPWSDVEAVLPHLSKDPDRQAVLADLVRVHWLTGMRPSEVLRMRPRDLDLGGKVWRYVVPGGGKNVHRGKVGLYFIGPRARAILSRHLDGCPADRPVFAIPPRKSPGRGKGRWINLTRDTYRRRVSLACRKAKVPHWHPHQLRHSRATEVQRLYECDAAAAAAIGTTPAVAGQIYADPNEEVRLRIAMATG